jgi:hypothetical protein
LLVGVVAGLLGTPWSAFVLLGYGVAPALPFGLVLCAGLAWAAFTWILIQRWISSPAWRAMHRFALTCGGTAACMLGGFLVFHYSGALPLDWIGKSVLNLCAVAGLLWLGRAVRRRESAPAQSSGDCPI